MLDGLRLPAMRKLRMSVVSVAGLAGLAGCGGGGVSAHDALAYTCGQYENTPTNQTTAEWNQHNEAVLSELLRVHGYPAGTFNLAVAKGEAEALCAFGNGALSDASATTKVDDVLDWAHAGLTHDDVD